jgi:hypothetical protein
LSPEWVSVLTVLYAGCGTVLIAGYVPQLLSAWNDRSGARAVSVVTWGLWCGDSLVEFCYAALVARDTTFSAVSFGHFLGCLVILAVALLRRWQGYRAGRDPACDRRRAKADRRTEPRATPNRAPVQPSEPRSSDHRGARALDEHRKRSCSTEARAVRGN